MPNYRRVFVPGGCWFFTVNLLSLREPADARIIRRWTAEWRVKENPPYARLSASR